MCFVHLSGLLVMLQEINFEGKLEVKKTILQNLTRHILVVVWILFISLVVMDNGDKDVVMDNGDKDE